MATTFEKWNGTKRHNYCTLPTIDVEILEPIHHCAKCNGLLVGSPGKYGMTEWNHAEPVTDEHYTSPKTSCHFCHSENAVYVQHAWYDATECNRCGGVNGYAIGD